MTVTTINVSDMHCASCSNKIRGVLRSLEEIQQLQFNPVRRQVYVTHADSLHSAALLEQIEDAGFHPRLESDSRVLWPESAALLKRLACDLHYFEFPCQAPEPAGLRRANCRNSSQNRPCRCRACRSDSHPERQ